MIKMFLMCKHLIFNNLINQKYLLTNTFPLLLIELVAIVAYTGIPHQYPVISQIERVPGRVESGWHCD